MNALDLKVGGKYITRDGKEVDIYEIVDINKASFNCHGYIHTKRGKRITSKWNIWNTKGHFTAFVGHDSDIVSEAV